MTYMEKVEKIASEDRDHVQSELYSLAEWLKSRYPNMDSQEINRFINEMLNITA